MAAAKQGRCVRRRLIHANDYQPNLAFAPEPNVLESKTEISDFECSCESDKGSALTLIVGSNRNNLISRGFSPFVNWLIHERPLWLRIAPLAFLALCVMSSYLWWGDISHSHSISFDTLTESFENTRQSYKGLEAFVLAGLDQKFEQSIGNYPVTEGFVAAFNNLQNKVAMSTLTQPKVLEGSLKVEPPDARLITEKFITNTTGDGFLFIPGMLVGISNASNENILKEATQDESQLKADIVVSREIAGNLKDFLSTQVIKVSETSKEHLVIADTPVQSYFLSATGVIHLHEANVADVKGYYSHNFTPTTFFPDRPYFWDTFKDKSTIGQIKATGPYTVSGIFKKTKPYVDLGGNGIVVTLSRGIERDGMEAALLLDFSLGDEAKTFIKKKIEQLGGTAKETSWVVTRNHENPQHYNVEPLGGDALTDQQREAVRAHIKVNNAKLSTIFGNLYVLDDLTKRGTVVFTVPVGPPTSREGLKPGQAAGTLLYCELDMGRFQRLISIKAALIALSFAGFVFFIILLVREYARRLDEQEKALQSVGRIMSQAPVAYCRLNERDQFIAMNKAFAELLGYEDLLRAEESLINKQTFEGLLADEKSHKEYDRIREERRNRKDTEPYSVRLRGEEGIVEVQVHGASIPMPKSHRKATPQTFGILLEEGVEVISERSMIITPHFPPPSAPPEPTDLFVLMPFRPELKLVYKNHIVDVATRLGLSVSRADEVLSTQAVMLDVWASICAARAIIADCTGRNPNVFYEIGIAHVVGKPVILITQNVSDIPFDISHLRYFVYEYTPEGMKQFESSLEKLIGAELGVLVKQRK